MATWAASAPIWWWALGGLVLCAIPPAGARWAWRRFADRHAVRVTVAAVLALAAVPLYAYTFLVTMLAVAAVGCPPDAYECPL